MMLPNCFLFSSFGKCLFSLFDVACGVCVYALFRGRGLSRESSQKHASIWLFNPLVIVIATRGSCDSVECFLLFLLLLLLQQDRFFAAAIVYGVAVHFRIYPIVFALALVRFCCWRTGSFRTALRFAVVSTATFLLLLLLCYGLYGWDFLEAAYLHHLHRTDVKHNYSVYFFIYTLRSTLRGLEWAPHLLLFPLISLRYYKNLPLCLFLLTFLFVAFNKVITAQYFVWWLSLLILLLPSSSLSARQWLGLFSMFLTAMNVWNVFAYQLEFYGRSVFVELWLACLLFVVVEVLFVVAVLRSVSCCCVCCFMRCFWGRVCMLREVIVLLTVFGDVILILIVYGDVIESENYTHFETRIV